MAAEARISARIVRPAYQAATRVPGPVRGARPMIVAGSSRPTATLSALLFSAVLSAAAPRPRVDRRDGVGQAGDDREHQAPGHDAGHAEVPAQRGRRP